MFDFNSGFSKLTAFFLLSAILYSFRVNNDLSSWVDRHERLIFLQMRQVFRAPMPKLTHVSNSSLRQKMSSKAKAKKLQRIQDFRRFWRICIFDISFNFVSIVTKLQVCRNSAVKKEEAKLKATRERAWRHLDLISSTGKATAEPHSAR